MIIKLIRLSLINGLPHPFLVYQWVINLPQFLFKLTLFAKIPYVWYLTSSNQQTVVMCARNILDNINCLRFPLRKSHVCHLARSLIGQIQFLLPLTNNNGSLGNICDYSLLFTSVSTCFIFFGRSSLEQKLVLSYVVIDLILTIILNNHFDFSHVVVMKEVMYLGQKELFMTGGKKIPTTVCRFQDVNMNNL